MRWGAATECGRRVVAGGVLVATIAAGLVLPGPPATAATGRSHPARHLHVVRVTGHSARPEWTLPTRRVARVLVRYAAGAKAPSRVSRAKSVARRGRVTGVDLQGLASGRTYSVSVFVEQVGLRYSARVSRTFTTKPTLAGPPTITTTVLPSATVGSGYAAALTTADGRPGTWAITTGSLPAGLVLSGQSITGTPLESGSYPVTIQFTDSHGLQSSRALTVSVAAGPDGPAWTPAELPTPPDADANPSVSVSGLSCANDGFCVAVGGYTAGVSSGQGLILTGLDGQWQATRAPVPDDLIDKNAELNAISCPADGTCVAVGFDTNASGGAFTDTLNDGVWTAADVPAPANQQPFTAIDCPSATSCVAVTGDYVLQLTGTTWTDYSLPLPADAGSDPTVRITGVSCGSATTCLAVGGYGPPSNGTGPLTHPLIETLAGGSWSAQEPALPADASASPAGSLSKVSCPDAADCLAIGQYESADANRGLLEQLTGGTWTASAAALPANAAAHAGNGTRPTTLLEDVTCAAVNQCTLVGEYGSVAAADPNFYHSEALIDQLSNGQWTSINAPLPSDATTDPGPYLLSASCTDTSDCVAVGSHGERCGAGCSYGQTYLEDKPLLEAYRNGVWTAVTGRSPNGQASGSVRQVACPQQTHCVAVGNYSNTNSDLRPFTETAPT